MLIIFLIKIFNMNYKDVLLTNENLVKAVTNIFDNVNGNYILPSIKIAQDLDLEDVIGTVLKEELQKQVYSNTYKNRYKMLLDDYIQPFLTYSAIVRLIPTVSYKITNAGVVKTDDEKMTSLSPSDVDKVKAEYQKIADAYRSKLGRFLMANYNDYPELKEYRDVSDIRANVYSYASSSICLGGNRGKKISY